jgi:hypothetical protein
MNRRNPHDQPSRFVLTLEAGHDPETWRTPTYRLKLALKILWRTFGFRCVSVTETPRTDKQHPDKEPRP